jgi:hypothetical protein
MQDQDHHHGHGHLPYRIITDMATYILYTETASIMDTAFNIQGNKHGCSHLTDRIILTDTAT